MKVTSIRFPAQWTELDSLGQPRRRVGDTHFELGKGPCGKTVISLTLTQDENGNFVIVTQDCSDSSTQEFLYRTVDILGRIVIHQE